MIPHTSHPIEAEQLAPTSLTLFLNSRTNTVTLLTLFTLPHTPDTSHLQELGTLLNVAPIKAEQLASEMIGEGRLHGRIDQVEGFIFFEDSLEQLVQWDKQVANVCVKVDALLDTIGTLTAANGVA